jgi:hypothetical protein
MDMNAFLFITTTWMGAYKQYCGGDIVNEGNANIKPSRKN